MAVPMPPTPHRVALFANIRDLITLAALAVSGLTWGLKLDNQIDNLSARMARNEAKVDEGILPIAEERIERLERDLARTDERLTHFTDAHEKWEADYSARWEREWAAHQLRQQQQR